MSKPEWSETPDWVSWISQDEDGIWFGYDIEPIALESEWGRMDLGFFGNGRCILLERGKPSGEWRNTLEPRP
jgi:hypothetical protein